MSRQFNREFGARADFAFHTYGALVGHNNFSDDVQTQAQARCFVARRHHALKAFKNFIVVFRGDAYALVLYLQMGDALV